MNDLLAADLIVVAHLVFIVFVMVGGVCVVRWRWVAALHIPAALWGALVEFTGWICPLTPLENEFRQAAGMAGYSGGFVEHYLLPLIYPPGLTRTIQIVLGLLVVTVNGAAYAVVAQRWRQTRQSRQE